MNSEQLSKFYQDLMENTYICEICGEIIFPQVYAENGNAYVRKPNYTENKRICKICKYRQKMFEKEGNTTEDNKTKRRNNHAN